MDALLATEYSDASDYPEIAAKALKEMYRQKGSSLHLADDQTAESGIIIRHLVLPGQVENSKKVLRFIAEEISSGLHLSLMSQYYPTPGVIHHTYLKRGLYLDEYSAVIEEMDRLGMTHGWTQEMESSGHYQPDFRKDHPFEDQN
jgi:putative pyruvate formate lyase activating enzyme